MVRAICLFVVVVVVVVWKARVGGIPRHGGKAKNNTQPVKILMRVF